MCVLFEGILGLLGVLLWGVFTSCCAPKNASRASAVAPCRGGDIGIPEEGTGSRRCQRVPEQGSKVALEYHPPSGLLSVPRSIPFARAPGTYFRSFLSRAPGTEALPKPGAAGTVRSGAPEGQLRAPASAAMPRLLLSPRGFRGAELREFSRHCRSVNDTLTFFNWKLL